VINALIGLARKQSKSLTFRANGDLAPKRVIGKAKFDKYIRHVIARRLQEDQPQRSTKGTKSGENSFCALCAFLWLEDFGAKRHVTAVTARNVELTR